MKQPKPLWIAILMLLLLPCALPAAETTGKIRLKAGEMALLPFLEMVSEKLDIQIDASYLGHDSAIITVPDFGPLSPARAEAVVLTTLSQQGYNWIHDTAIDIYRVSRQRDARDLEIPVIMDAGQLPDSDLMVTYIMGSVNTPPEYIARTLRSFMPANSRIIPDEASGSIFITDSAHNITKLIKLVQRLDTAEAGKQAKEWLLARAKGIDASCPPPVSGPQAPPPSVLIILFSLIALVIGFLSRGYVIRRIEGGL